VLPFSVPRKEAMKMAYPPEEDTIAGMVDGKSLDPYGEGVDEWRWQLRNRITTVEQLSEYVELTGEQKAEIEEVGQTYRWAVTPHLAGLMDPQDPNCPIRMQFLPSRRELENTYCVPDPLDEESMHPVPAITKRYPDRLIIYTTNQCASFCRHCQRRRLIGEADAHTPREQVFEAIEWIAEHPEVRDVLLTGGDALMLPTEWLETIIAELRTIPHVEIIRIGTRVPVSLPQRVDQELCEMLSRYHPVWLNTQFNHPKELTPEAALACDMLSRAGIPLGNQSVLLRGVNDDPQVMKRLAHALLRIRVRPYYLFQCNPTRGTEHFRTPLQRGIEIIESLRGWTSGLAIPTFVVNAPGGGGKMPVGPNYVLSWGPDYVLMRNWRGEVARYPNPSC